MNCTSIALRHIGLGAIVLAMTILIPAHGAENTDTERKRETPVSPESKKRQDAYDAAVRQCQSKSGTAKQECVENAKMKYGEMLK